MRWYVGHTGCFEYPLACIALQGTSAAMDLVWFRRSAITQALPFRPEVSCYGSTYTTSRSPFLVPKPIIKDMYSLLR